ncbi:GlxA family transcriptional regulator [Tabrizicola oligotrophica]|uniref:GlxA family transcriptional regulator n=1 Tax=Tabrizicola oligotrophica TaxID=2710650 RepID=A0A6M0QPW4_9RHOB|nr:GlxA family transcriptional regulator [Tabrizicola oligotrophica]NEY89515.1 GlxA family transcriptional regulator [Tabrizicola oligotrophica]
MRTPSDQIIHLLVIVTPNFNLLATTGLIDPLRAANYLDGTARFRWSVASSEGGMTMASNGLGLATQRLGDLVNEPFDMVVVSSSWAPEAHDSPALLAALRKFARNGCAMGALDTGAFLLAKAGLLAGRRATVHYEHIDSLRELREETDVTEDLYVFDDNRFTCCGGTASVDLGLHILRGTCGDSLANAAARYIFHPGARPPGTPQNPAGVEPLGHATPDSVRRVIAEMERHLEEPLTIPELCDKARISQRQINRLFTRYVGKTPQLYYRDIRLDRARGLVTQTELPMSEIAVASGFASQAHFSKAYHERFGIQPRVDRVEGRIPFEFRAWPMHRKPGQQGKTDGE